MTTVGLFVSEVSLWFCLSLGSLHASYVSVYSHGLFLFGCLSGSFGIDK